MQWKSETYIHVLDTNEPAVLFWAFILWAALQSNFFFTLYCIIDHVIKFLQFCYFLVCLEMHFVGNGDCIENDLLALSYHLFAEECDFC